MSKNKLYLGCLTNNFAGHFNFIGSISCFCVTFMLICSLCIGCCCCIVQYFSKDLFLGMVTEGKSHDQWLEKVERSTNCDQVMI